MTTACLRFPLLRAVRTQLIRLMHRVIPAKLVVVAEVIICHAVGHHHDCDAAVTGHERRPECAGIAVGWLEILCPETIVVLEGCGSGGGHAAVVGILLHGILQHAGVEDLRPFRITVIVVEKFDDFGDVVLRPEQTISAEWRAERGVVRADGADARA
jgi:hypothetical protein